MWESGDSPYAVVGHRKNLQTNQGLENLLNNGSIYLLRDLVAYLVVGNEALAVGDEAGFGPRHEGAE